MSRSNRNAGRNANHQLPIPHQEFFDDWRLRENMAVQLEELPSERIEWRINLNQNNVPAGLERELRNIDMDVTKPNPRVGVIIISGIPRVNGFGNQQVLQIVRRHTPNAVLA